MLRVSCLSAAALPMLQPNEGQAPVPQNKSMGDIEELAASYERKLIEVSLSRFILHCRFLLFFDVALRTAVVCMLRQ